MAATEVILIVEVNYLCPEEARQFLEEVQRA
jgi:hypothetical protein